MNSCFKIVLFLYFSFSRRPRALTDVFEKNEKKNKTTSVYRLIVLKTMHRILLVPGFKDHNFTCVQTRAILVIFFQNIHLCLFFLNCS